MLHNNSKIEEKKKEKNFLKLRKKKIGFIDVVIVVVIRNNFCFALDAVLRTAIVESKKLLSVAGNTCKNQATNILKKKKG